MIYLDLFSSKELMSYKISVVSNFNMALDIYNNILYFKFFYIK